MKTVCKRLLTLMLVAVMLVSAVPMAFAASETVATESVTLSAGETVQAGLDWVLANKSIPEYDDVVATIGGEEKAMDFTVEAETAVTYTFTKELPPSTITVTITKDGSSVVNGVTYTTDAAVTVADLLANYGVDYADCIVSPAPTTEVQPGGSVSITVTTDNSKVVTLYYFDGNDARQSMTVTTNAQNQLSEVPNPPVVRTNYDFIGWYSVDGTQGGDKLTAGADVAHDTYYARYQANFNNPKHTVQVYGRVYVGGVYKATTGVLVDVKAFNGSKTLDELKAQTAAIKEALNNSRYSTYNGYEWEANEIFYDDSALTDPVKQSDKITSNDTYYIRVNYTNNNDREHLEKVQIYVHTKKNSTINRTITLTTYAPGETITKTIVTNAVKKYYSVANKNVKMYDIESWEQILDGNANTDETAEFEVVRGDDTHIHVLLTGATSKGDTTSSNPKTGDAIFMTITALGLSGTALVALYFINKKKTIV